MPSNISIIIFNNVKSIIIHIFICILCIYPFAFLWEAPDGIFIWMAIGIYTIANIFLYFIAGWIFLRETYRIIESVCSVIALACLIIFIVLFSSNVNFLNFFTISFYPIGGVISNILFRIPYGAAEEKYILILPELLPSLCMWFGLKKKSFL